MTKKLFKVFTAIICSLILFSCEKDKLGDSIESYSLMDYYEQIKNKEGIDIKSLQCVNQYSNRQGEISDITSFDPNIECINGDTTILWGFRNNKIWIGLFKRNTKEQLIEWTSNNAIDRNMAIDKGYGEFEYVHIDKLKIHLLKYTSFGFIYSFCYICGDNILNGCSVLLNGTNSFLYPNPIHGYKIWYGNSIISSKNVISFDTGKDICILQDYPQSGYADFEVQPLSYTDGLSFDQSYVSIEENGGLYECIIRKNYETGKDIWKTPITQLKNIESNARKTVTILDKDDKQWTFQFDVVNYDGSKQQVKFSVDIATGEIIYL